MRSLAYRTDLYFPRFEGVIEQRGGYVVVRTPANPGYYWGNYLLFPTPPRAGDLLRWRDCFDGEFSGVAGVRHVAFGWDTTEPVDGDSAPFERAGFRLVKAITFAAADVHAPSRTNPLVEVRALRDDADWAAASRNQCVGANAAGDTAFIEFKRVQMARYRRMADACLGAWFGAFLDGHLVGDLGAFGEKGVFRFQSVVTHPRHRGRGVCRTLVYRAARELLERHGANALVIVAEEGHAACGIYRAVGFVPREYQRGLFRPPQGMR